MIGLAQFFHLETRFSSWIEIKIEIQRDLSRNSLKGNPEDNFQVKNKINENNTLIEPHHRHTFSLSKSIATTFSIGVT